VQEIAVDLAVQVVSVGHHHESEVAGELAEDLARVEHHREALARALGVPEHAQLAAQPRRWNCSKALFTPMNWWFCAMTFCVSR
jgi:hypothetical protein